VEQAERLLTEAISREQGAQQQLQEARDTKEHEIKVAVIHAQAQAEADKLVIQVFCMLLCMRICRIRLLSTHNAADEGGQVLLYEWHIKM
jgi:hypothetical protein